MIFGGNDVAYCRTEKRNNDSSISSIKTTLNDDNDTDDSDDDIIPSFLRKRSSF